METAKPRLVLIDGHAHVFRAFHGMARPLTNSKGVRTEAVFGFLQIFQRLRKEHRIGHLAVVFDPPGGSFRDAVYPAYKGTRDEAPPEIFPQVELTKKILAAMGVQVVEVPGFEADDAIATLAEHARQAGGEALIVSVDKDLMQMVGEGITILRDHLGKVEMLDPAAVVARTGVKPDQIPDYLGMVGDASDNLPGIDGVGPKTAAKLLSEFGTLEGVIAAAPGMKASAMREKIVACAEKARLSRQLAVLRRDAPVDFSWERFAWEFKPTSELREMYRELEFRGYLEDLAASAPDDRATDYGAITTAEELATAIAEIRAAGLAAIDTETTGLDPHSSELVGISLSWAKDQGRYIPLGHAAEGAKQLSLDEVRAALQPVLDDPAVCWVAHHWNFDYKMLHQHGFRLGAIGSDTLLAAFLCNPDRSGKGLKNLSLECLGIRMTEIKTLIGSGDDMATMATVSVEESAEYASADADCTLQLHHYFAPRVAEAELGRVYREIELPLTPVLARMELAGARIDVRHFDRLSNDARIHLDAMTREIHALAGRPFNLNSPKQVAEILFEELKLPAARKGKTGYSTDAAVLEGLVKLHPLPAKLLEFRELDKLKSTYLDPLPRLVHHKTGRLHSSFSQTVAATGRLSSSDPNLQNIPIRTEQGREIRRGFIPASGCKLLAADYSQIELRILAHMSGDAALREAFESGEDIHRLTASRVFRVSPADVSPVMRSQAKAVNFGIIYGMSAFGLANSLDISREQAERFIADYFAAYSGVKRWLDETIAQCRRDGFVRTLCGRRRFIPDINGAQGNVRQQGERVAVNTPIQGTSADMIKLAMIRVQRRLDASSLKSRMILQVHDELILEVPESEAAEAEALVREEMSAALPLSVPVVVDTAVGDNWAEI